ncbi:RsmB/NOP family class I SAM-dependent RNA methyltransferase [Oceanibacterium hippocampi]|uniref:Ribosomal RNA small subunit methyltransferase B n=1 Tax=Oceanibacterium hippocampi TaxID=745714 RepID=A0A1Y5SSP2_9PROT|nr:RsmB/NOP family class I SAM-dependent RNA methyltransferase [Oceanibacterium hippocampi]SLN46875.1 Ribosomal RNA small subunit methyltransferase B [Oceanibacterium hippocampi]
MIPAARLAALIELLDGVQGAALPADRVAQRYFRERRFIGSKDRNWIGDALFAVGRDLGRLRWRLDRLGRAPDGRALVLAQRHAEGDERSLLESQFSGERYTPAALDADDRALLDGLDGLTGPAAEAMPGWARDNYPDWMEAPLRARFGADLGQAMAAYGERAPLGLRVNLLKASREKAAAALAEEGIETTPMARSPLGLVAGRAALGASPAYRRGLVEVQDEASQLCALACAARPGEQVVDFCAGAGGKSLALAAAMANKGQIHAFDIDARALGELKKRADRAGIRNLQTRRIAAEDDRSGEPLPADLAGRADLVLVDAPCSGSGTWRRNPFARWQLEAADVERQATRQAALLDRASALVRPGGRLFYAVCSVFPVEGEAVVAAFLAANPDFRPRPLDGDWLAETGLKGSGEDGAALVLLPHVHGTDGFFVAAFERA